MEKIEGSIKIAGSLIAIIIPCILLAGYSFHLGYIMTYGLSADLVSKSMSDMLAESWYVGVMAMAWVLSKWPYILSGSTAFFLFFVGVFFFLIRAKKNGVTWPFEEITKENKGKTIFGITQWHWVCLGQLFNDIVNWVFHASCRYCFDKFTNSNSLYTLKRLCRRANSDISEAGL